MPKPMEMLKSYSRTDDVDVSVLAEAIEALIECAITCIQCADACLSEQEVKPMVKCIRLDLDCADVCTAASRVVSRQTEYDPEVTRPVLEACIRVCKSCSDECEGHGQHMDHCRLCAESCRRCVKACQALLDAIA